MRTRGFPGNAPRRPLARLLGTPDQRACHVRGGPSVQNQSVTERGSSGRVSSSRTSSSAANSQLATCAGPGLPESGPPAKGPRGVHAAQTSSNKTTDVWTRRVRLLCVPRIARVCEPVIGGRQVPSHPRTPGASRPASRATKPRWAACNSPVAQSSSMMLQPPMASPITRSREMVGYDECSSRIGSSTARTVFRALRCSGDPSAGGNRAGELDADLIRSRLQPRRPRIAPDTLTVSSMLAPPNASS